MDLDHGLTALTALTALCVAIPFLVPQPSIDRRDEELPHRLFVPTGLRCLKLVEWDMISGLTHRAHDLVQLAGETIHDHTI